MTYSCQACVTYLQCMVRHHKRIRTTNLPEHSLLEERRIKVIPRFITEEGCTSLVFATLRWATHRGQGVKMSEQVWQ